MNIDNAGDVLLLYDTLVSQHTKHIDVHHQFIWNYVEDITVKTRCAHSEENLADLFTNSFSNEPFQFLTSSYLHCE